MIVFGAAPVCVSGPLVRSGRGDHLRQVDAQHHGGTRALNCRLPADPERFISSDQRACRTSKTSSPKGFTRDSFKTPVVSSVFVGWQITERGGVFRIAQRRHRQEPKPSALERLLGTPRTPSSAGIRFLAICLRIPARFKFEQIESEMKAVVQNQVNANHYGHRGGFGIKQLGLPESLTAKVFDRMKTEREKLVKSYIAEGEAEATKIKSGAERERRRIAGQGRAATPRKSAGKAEAEATKSWRSSSRIQSWRTSPIFRLKLRGLEQFKDRSTLILDPNTPPSILLRGDTDQP